ncbi:MAG: hypothetical protein ABFS39_18045 [Pseudomonadota bacterium]
MKTHDTPMLDQLETGEWPSFISGIKRLRDKHPDERIRETNNDLLGQLEHSYETIKGYWKGGTVSVFGYGGGIIPRFSEVGDLFPKSKEFHTLRVQPPAGNYYTTDILRTLAENTIDFFAENALEHERIGEMIERIGLVNFLEAMDLEIDPQMVVHPRENSYVRTDTWDEEAARWYERHPHEKKAADAA